MHLLCDHCLSSLYLRRRRNCDRRNKSVLAASAQLKHPYGYASKTNQKHPSFQLHSPNQAIIHCHVLILLSSEAAIRARVFVFCGNRRGPGTVS